MSEFVFLFRGDDMSGSPEALQKQMQRWGEWMKELTAKGHMKGGQPLEPTGRVVDRKQTVIDGPYAEAKDLIGGFMVIECENISHACELAKGCPIFLSGGFVEVRPVMKLSA